MSSRGRSSWRKQAKDFKSSLGGLDGIFGAESRRRAERDALHEAELREKACTSKNRYLDEEEALEALDECARYGRRNIRIYRCPYCDGWHLTSKSQR